jgi:phenylacetate-CoA ligase
MSIRSYIIPKLSRQRLELLKKQSIFYDTQLSVDEKKKIQFDRFNTIWYSAHRNIPFYKNWKKVHSLPGQVDSLSALNDFPNLTKNDIQKNNDLILSGSDYDLITSTGGSTGQPTKFPMVSKEFDQIYSNTYLGRGWWGVKPFEKTVLIWGHSHLFGTGLKGRVSQTKRKFTDFMINTKRLNAYDMSHKALRHYWNEIQAFKPKMVIGYASSLYKLSKFALENNLLNTNTWSPSVVVSTSETLTKSEIQLIEKAFNSKVAQEYGLAEAGVVAYTKPGTQQFEVFWDSFLCISDVLGSLTITTLYDKSFPLIKYQTDDLITPTNKFFDAESILSFKKIKGRTQHVLSIKSLSGRLMEISGILIIHILKSHSHIYSVQSRQLYEGSIVIDFVASHDLNIQNLKEFFLKEFMKKHEPFDTAAVQLNQVESIKLSVAGKEIVALDNTKRFNR